MKKMLIMTSLVFGSVLHSIAAEAESGNTKSNVSEKVSGETKTATKTAAVSKTLSATERANNLTNEMIRDLKLNNYQARKLRAINLEKVNRMMAIEAKGGDPSKVDDECFGVCKQSDAILEDILSTDQYTKYFTNRSDYFKFDKEYAKGGYLKGASAKANLDKLDNNDDDTPAEQQQYASR